MGMKFLRMYPRKPVEQGRVNAAVARGILDVLALDARRQARFLGYAAASHASPSALVSSRTRDSVAPSH
ncbi:hypothetical protein [Noviherbaspirillum sp.]|jgi:pyruvate-formate lyase|uniref:hypothetical protein n=1 Tax=Noviherbaspirillum sp. TaxID=1926288 RepID=UPI0025F2BAEA|nr:hypothetical protein [Noviherbaspirillum sp.]